MAPSRKPRLAILANAPSPYRVHQHERIVREMGDEIDLWSLFFYEHNWQPWTRPLPPEIQPVVFGPGESNEQKSRRGGWLRQWRKAGQVIDWLQANQIDALITTGYNDPGLMRIVRWCHRHRLPNFMLGDANVHSDRAQGLKRLIKKFYVGWIVRNLTGFMPCGIYGRQYFDAYGGAALPWFYMPHEPNYAKIFRVTADQRGSTMAKFGLRPDRRYFMYSGRLAEVKRVDTLIDAFARLADERPAWDLLIVGGGPLEAELKARVPQRLRDRVVWTGFIDDTDELSSLYTCGHVFVLPSSYEPWAVVVCEATAAGMPVVTSRVVGAAGELCREGTNGRLFTPGDVAGLTAALLDVTQSDQRLAQLSLGSLAVLDDWRRRGDPVQGVRLALAHVGLLPPPPPVAPNPPTPQRRPAYT